jgi:hypothetical protein
MGWVFLILLVIGGIVYGVDQIKAPPSDCESDELGCKFMKQLKDDGTINEFESIDPAKGDLTTWEINDDDSLLIHMDASSFQVEYPSDKKDLASELDERLKDYVPPGSELP